MSDELKPTAFARTVGISVPYASQILRGLKTPTHALAIRIYRATGRKMPPIEGVSDAEIEVLERFAGASL